MKAYTDLSQSKKLIAILPLESADMLFQLGEDKYADSIRVPLTKEHWEQMMPDIKPCWSASALLEVIRNNGRYELQMYEGGYYFQSNGFMTESYFNPIDACVDMILKLKERDLL